MFLSKKKLASSAGNSVCPSTGSCVVYGRAGYAGGLRGRVARVGWGTRTGTYRVACGGAAKKKLACLLKG